MRAIAARIEGSCTVFQMFPSGKSCEVSVQIACCYGNLVNSMDSSISIHGSWRSRIHALNPNTKRVKRLSSCGASRSVHNSLREIR